MVSLELNEHFAHKTNYFRHKDGRCGNFNMLDMTSHYFGVDFSGTKTLFSGYMVEDTIHYTPTVIRFLRYLLPVNALFYLLTPINF